MRAVRLHGRADLRVETLADPPMPAAGQVLIRPRSCGICGTDLHEFVAGPIILRADPHPLTAAAMPQILGHEFAGDVVAIGPGVHSVHVGDRVAVMPLISCGSCRYCLAGESHLCEVMACTGLTDRWGGMSGFVLVREYQAYRLADNLSYDEGALIEPAAVALRAVERSRPLQGDPILITGAGPIGSLVALVAAALGLGKIYMSEPNPKRRRWAQEAGICDAVLDPVNTDVGAQISDKTAGQGVSIAFECAGHQSALQACFAAVRRGGTVVQTALFTGPANVDPYLWCFKDLRIEATWGYPTDVWPRLIELARSGKLDLKRVVTGRIDLNETPKGFARLLDHDGGEIKILIQNS